MLRGRFTYIMASKTGRIYIGVTSNLLHRVAQHKGRLHPGSFTASYNVDHLVYVEVFESITEAIAREDAIKGLSRLKKIQLIIVDNPTWQDLAKEWPMPGTPFDESKSKPPTTF